MGQNILWFKEQWEDKKYRVYFVITLMVSAGLMAEFYLFDYSVAKSIRYLVLIAALFLIAWIDRRTRRIPNKILKILLMIRTGLFLLEWMMFPRLGLSLLISVMLGALLGGGMFLLAHFISRGGVGMGDVKLVAAVGIYMGGGSIMACVFLSVMASSVYSIIMLICKKIKLKEEIPFAPFVFIGTVLTMALGM